MESRIRPAHRFQGLRAFSPDPFWLRRPPPRLERRCPGGQLYCRSLRGWVPPALAPPVPGRGFSPQCTLLPVRPHRLSRPIPPSGALRMHFGCTTSVLRGPLGPLPVPSSHYKQIHCQIFHTPHPSPPLRNVFLSPLHLSTNGKTYRYRKAVGDRGMRGPEVPAPPLQPQTRLLNLPRVAIFRPFTVQPFVALENTRRDHRS